MTTPINKLIDAYEIILARYGVDSEAALAFYDRHKKDPLFVEYAEMAEHAARKVQGVGPPRQMPPADDVSAPRPVYVDVDLSGGEITTGDWSAVDDLWKQIRSGEIPSRTVRFVPEEDVPVPAGGPTITPKRWVYVVMPFLEQPDQAKMNALGDEGWEAFAVTRSFVLFRMARP